MTNPAREVQRTSIAAQRADLAWTKQLFLNGFKSRWAPGAHGEVGTTLRAAYDAKLAADRANHAAWEVSRAQKREELRNEVTNTGDC